MKVGYTTGVFDMFHVGHLRILQRAKQLCDHLIVGVSTDELVQSYKNKTPIIPFCDRMEIVAAVRWVDKVIPQTHRDKVRQCHEIGFDVMFVGDDWKNDKLFIETEKELRKCGVEIVYFPYTRNVSSTLFRDILQNIDNLTREL